MLTKYADYDTMGRALRIGAFDYVESTAVQKDEMFLKVKLDHACDRSEDEQKRLVEEFRRIGFIGRHPIMVQLFREIETLAKGQSTVLIEGESGTGKELVAKALHLRSPRADKPLIVMDCTTLQETLAESTLFGIEKRVATEVSERTGKFELADDGTLFLDEIADLPLTLQPKLLRVLEEKTIEKVGSAKPVPVDVRVVCATNKKLQAEVSRGNFRSDLYYRIASAKITVPNLAQRLSDIPLLAMHFISKHSDSLEKDPPDITPEALAYLQERPWPSNVRGLDRTMLFLVGSTDRIITLMDLHRYFERIQQNHDDLVQEEIGNEYLDIPPADGTLRALERWAIIRSLRSHDGYIEPAATALGIGKSKMYERIKLYELKHLVKGFTPKSSV
jgi:DNA-binding NtrC family response regulator